MSRNNVVFLPFDHAASSVTGKKIVNLNSLNLRQIARLKNKQIVRLRDPATGRNILGIFLMDKCRMSIKTLEAEPRFFYEHCIDENSSSACIRIPPDVFLCIHGIYSCLQEKSYYLR